PRAGGADEDWNRASQESFCRPGVASPGRGSIEAEIRLAQVGEKSSERLEVVDLRHDRPQRAHSSWNVSQKMLMSPDQTQKAISTQRLHQALHRAQLQGVVELLVNCPPIVRLFLQVITDQLRSLCG